MTWPKKFIPSHSMGNFKKISCPIGWDCPIRFGALISNLPLIRFCLILFQQTDINIHVISDIIFNHLLNITFKQMKLLFIKSLQSLTFRQSFFGPYIYITLNYSYSNAIDQILFSFFLPWVGKFPHKQVFCTSQSNLTHNIKKR